MSTWSILAARMKSLMVNPPAHTTQESHLLPPAACSCPPLTCRVCPNVCRGFVVPLQVQVGVVATRLCHHCQSRKQLQTRRKILHLPFPSQTRAVVHRGQLPPHHLPQQLLALQFGEGRRSLLHRSADVVVEAGDVAVKQPSNGPGSYPVTDSSIPHPHRMFEGFAIWCSVSAHPCGRFPKSDSISAGKGSRAPKSPISPPEATTTLSDCRRRLDQVGGRHV